MKRLVDDLDAIAALVTGPDCRRIKDVLQQLVQRLHDVDFGVVTQSLDQVYADVRGKVAALDPRTRRRCGSPGSALSALDLDQAIQRPASRSWTPTTRR